ncbi:MAG: hypothetical protein K2Q28_10000 [Hyphomicrobium sp.]|nr:hypothetical protein [Hyphomicrobium sp.]
MTHRPLAAALFTTHLHSLEDHIDHAVHRAGASLQTGDASNPDAASLTRIFEDLVLIHQQARALCAHYHAHSLENDFLYE